MVNLELSSYSLQSHSQVTPVLALHTGLGKPTPWLQRNAARAPQPVLGLSTVFRNEQQDPTGRC